MLVHLLLWREMGHKSLLVRIAWSTLTWSMAQKSPWRWRRIITMKLYYVRIRMQSRQLNVCHLRCPRQVRFITIFRLTYYTPILDNARLRCRALSSECHDLAIKVCIWWLWRACVLDNHNNSIQVIDTKTHIFWSIKLIKGVRWCRVTLWSLSALFYYIWCCVCLSTDWPTS